MAEIKIDRKRGTSSWVWVLLVLVVLAAIGVYLWQSGTISLSHSGAASQFAMLSEGAVHHGQG